MEIVLFALGAMLSVWGVLRLARRQGGAGFLSGFWHACGPRLKLYLELQPSGGMNRDRTQWFIWILWHIYTVQTVYKK